MRRLLAPIGIAALATAALALPVGPSGAGVEPPAASVYVVHAIPGVPVDVCVGSATEPVIPNFEPGTVVGPLALPPGDYDISLHTVGEECGDTIYAETVTVPAGSSTIVAWNEASGDVDADLAVFANDVACTQPGTGRVTARHTAGAAGPVDVLANGTEVVSDLAPGAQADLDVPVGTYSLVVRADDGGLIVVGPVDVTVQEGKNLVLHVANPGIEEVQPTLVRQASVIPLVLDVGVCTPAPDAVEVPPNFTG